ncbi:MAG: phosphotransferase [bacterium]|nr:phosphotransferase [bacterium]
MALENYALLAPIVEFPLSQGVNNTIEGIHTGSGDYVLKHYRAPHHIESIQYEHDLLKWLAEQSLSFAVPTPIETPDGRSFYQDDDGYHVLMPLLPGQPVDCRNLIQVKAMGSALGELQSALIAHPLTPRPHAAIFGDLGHIHPLIPQPRYLKPEDVGWPKTRAFDALCAWWREEIAVLDTFLMDTYPLLPKQVIHGDIAPSNALYHDGRISAMLDFEFAGPDARVIDVASGLKFCMRIWENDAPWEIGSAFMQVYQGQISLTSMEWGSLIEIMILRDVVSTIWWLGRHLSDGTQPDPERMEAQRDFKRWLTTHRARLEDLWTEGSAA